MSRKKNLKRPHSNLKRKYFSKTTINALIAAGLVAFSVSVYAGFKKAIEVNEINTMQTEIANLDLSVKNEVPGKSKLDSIVRDFKSQNPDIESDFMGYLDAQKSIFDKGNMSASIERVNSYADSIKKLHLEIANIMSQYKNFSDSDEELYSLDNPMAIINEYNRLLQKVNEYDTLMPTGVDALKSELYAKVKSIKDKETILQDMKKRYLEEYNKTHKNSKLSIEDIKLFVHNQDYIIETEDGKYVTHGDFPDKNASFLGSNSNKTISNVDVYTVSNDGKLLESVARVNGKISTIYTPESLNENRNNETLKEFVGIIDAGLTWQKNPDDEFAIKKYVDALAWFYSAGNNIKNEDKQQEKTL